MKIGRNSLTFFSFIIFLFPSLFSSAAFGAQDTLAVVNGQPITSADFRNRFELSVYPGKDIGDNLYSAKRGFLQSMVAEKLLSNAASVENTAAEEILKRQMELIFLRDALYRTEVLPKAKVSEEEIAKGMILSSYYYFVDAFYFPDKASADVFYNSVTKKGSSIYALSDSMHVRHDTLQIGYGESTEEIEDAFFGRETGFVSMPTLTEDGYVVFKILDRRLNKKFTAPSLEDKTALIKKIIKGRKEEKLGYEYLMSVMKDVKVEVNYNIFKPLVYTIKSFLDKHQPSSYDPNYYLSLREINEIKAKYSSQLKSPLLRFNEGNITLGEALDQLTLSGFAPENTSVQFITESLHAALKYIVQNYFLAKRARQLGLQNSNEVKYNVQMFVDAYRAARLASQITDTVKVTRAQISEFFDSHKDEVLKDVRLRLQIFKVENIDEAAEILNRLNKIKEGAVDTAGAVWVNAYQLSELGGVLAEMPNGKIYGPLFIKGQYTIFRVLDKKSTLTKGAISNSIQDAREMLLAKTKQEVLNKYLADLAGEQNVKIYLNRLNEVEVTPIEMLTFRYIGFGGKILAVPSMYPMEGWLKYYDKKGNIVP